MDDLVGVTEIAELIGVTRQRAHQIANQKGFPDPVAVLAAGSVWSKKEVEQWVKRNRPSR